METALTKGTDWVRTARWGSFWSHYEELEEFSEQDFLDKAKKLSESGINAVITFGSFHFHWNFIEKWPRLLTMLKRTCDACHHYGIKVVEHHSACIEYAPIGEDWDNYANHCRRPEDSFFPDGDYLYKGVKLSSMRQIDPRTGQFARSGYKCWTLCHNNPDYQRLYFEHLEDVYACGVDGIMTDDIAFYPQGYSCGCLHCRQKFREDTGFSLPFSGKDDKTFYGNFDNPAYRAWVLWRISCYREHEARVKRHYRGLGLDLARPIYHSSSTNSYGTWGFGVSLDALDGLYSTVFTEVNSTQTQPHSFLRIAAECDHRSALARRNQVPPMCLFYPSNIDENAFCWGVTKLCGQNYWGTNHGMTDAEQNVMLAPTFNFEKEHEALYKDAAPIADVAVAFSSRTVLLHRDTDTEPRGDMSDPASTDCWAGWCELLTLSNIAHITLVEKDLDEGRIPEGVKVVILPNIVCVSDAAVKNLRAFVERGGKLIVTHQTGMKDETGKIREVYPLADLVGAEPTGEVSVARCHGVEKAFFNAFSLTAAVPFDAGDGAVFKNVFGAGEVIVFSYKPGRLICVNRHLRHGKDGYKFKYADIDFSFDKDIAADMLKCLDYLCPDRALMTVDFPYGVIAGLFRVRDDVVLHLLNAEGVLADSGKSVPIPSPVAFGPPKKNVTMKFRVKTRAKSATLYSLEKTSGVALRLASRGADGVEVEIPSELVAGYAVIKLAAETKAMEACS